MGANPFPGASGYGNFPSGNWSPVTFSQDLIMFNRTVSVAEEITNNDHVPQMIGQGSEIEIIKEPEITVKTYNRGTEFDIQEIDDDKVLMLIDQAEYFSFALDDIEQAFSHVAWASKILDAGGYALRNSYDTNILQYMVSNASTIAATTGVALGFTASTTTPLNYLGICRRILDENDVAETGRYIVVSPRFLQSLEDEDSSITDISYAGGNEYEVLRASKFGANRAVKGFIIYKSNNLPANTDVIYGNINAVSAVQAISKSKQGPREKTFGEQFAGLHVFGRKVIKAESIFYGTVSY